MATAISEYTNTATFNASATAPTSRPLTLPIGTTNVHAIIDLPPDGEDPNSALGQQRYYNKANLILLVSNSTVTLTLQSMPADPQATSITANYFPTNSSPTNYVQVTTNFPFLTLTNTFTDQRENDKVKVSDIDVGKLDKWLLTNKTATTKFPSTAGVYPASNAPNILYVADNRTYTNGQLTAVRLKNGATIPTNMVTIAGSNQPSGFTVATPNPLYVDGNYNCPNSTYALLHQHHQGLPGLAGVRRPDHPLAELGGRQQHPNFGLQRGRRPHRHHHRSQRRHPNGQRPFHRLRRQPIQRRGA